MAIRKLKIPGQLQTRAAFEPSTFKDDDGSVEVVFTTGARGMRYSWSEGRYFEELEVSDAAVDLSRLNNGASLLNAHSSYDLTDVIGVVERAWIQNGEGRATVRFSTRDDVKAIKADVKAGILRHISVGYSVSKYEKVEETDGVPVYRATRWTPAEISLVPIAFDDQAVVRSSPKDPVHEVDVETRGEPQESNAMTAEEIAAAEAKAKEQRDLEIKVATEKAAREERERASGIRSAVRAARLDAKFADALVDQGVDLPKARELVLAELGKRSAETQEEVQAPVQVGEADADKRHRGAVAALLLRSGTGNIARAKAKGAKGFENVDLDGGEFRGMTLLDIAKDYLERRGVKTRGMDRLKVAEMALNQRTGGMATISDFPVLLETAMYKQLLAAYATADDTWKKFCKTDTVPDFRTSNRYRTGSFGVLDSKTEHGEFKNKAIPDGTKYTVSTATKGNIIGITREAIINDDMGALSNLSSASAARPGSRSSRTSTPCSRRTPALGRRCLTASRCSTPATATSALPVRSR
jgi:hypothetical protein